jgi:predicted ATP-grasp superfamily ATP-dependent carboligase
MTRSSTPAPLRSDGGRPPAVLLGGSANALSIARSLGRRGIDIYLSVAKDHEALYSRFCRHAFPFDVGTDPAVLWGDLLLGGSRAVPAGSVVLACNDSAVTFIATHRDALAGRYRLDDAVPDRQLAMLDKLSTLKAARAAGVGAPRFWEIDTPEEADAVAGDLPYPVIVKPLLSHLFQSKFGGRKFFTARNGEEVRAQLAAIHKAGLQAMVCEWIPGPDHQLASYYTYIDGRGTALFRLTKRTIRRFPKNEGLASYHVTDWNDEVAAAGARFLEGAGFRGLANVEFKRDARDGQLKIIECNPRFAAPQELFVRCGLDIASLVYDHVTGRPVDRGRPYRHGVRLWYPIRDFRAYRELRRLNELTFGTWLRSILHRQAFPFFQTTDPLPAVVPALQGLARRLRPAAQAPNPMTQGTNQC